MTTAAGAVSVRALRVNDKRIDESAGSGGGSRGQSCRRGHARARGQRYWFHEIANVLNALPKSAQPVAKAALAETWNAEDRDHAAKAAAAFEADYATKWPKPVAKVDATELVVRRWG